MLEGSVGLSAGSPYFVALKTISSPDKQGATCSAPPVSQLPLLHATLTSVLGSSMYPAMLLTCAPTASDLSPLPSRVSRSKKLK